MTQWEFTFDSSADDEVRARFVSRELAEELARSTLASLQAALEVEPLATQVEVQPNAGGNWCKITYFLLESTEGTRGRYRKLYIDIREVEDPPVPLEVVPPLPENTWDLTGDGLVFPAAEELWWTL